MKQQYKFETKISLYKNNRMKFQFHSFYKQLCDAKIYKRNHAKNLYKASKKYAESLLQKCINAFKVFSYKKAMKDLYWVTMELFIKKKYMTKWKSIFEMYHCPLIIQEESSISEIAFNPFN